MPEKLVLLDVDNTLIDTNYRLNVSDAVFREAVQRAQGRGVAVGLSSDSGPGTLAALAKRFGLDGPIVAEKGAMVRIGAQTTRLNPETMVFAEIRERLVAHLVSEALKNRLLLALGDVNWLSQSIMEQPQTDSIAPAIVLVNTLRSASLSFYVRSNSETGWVIDRDALNSVFLAADTIGGCLAPAWWRDAVIDKNPDYGICIIHHPTTEKKNALPFLRNGHPECAIYMIGNSMSDWMGEGVTHCAVGNADAAFKEECGELVSALSLTEGVISLLEHIGGSSWVFSGNRF